LIVLIISKEIKLRRGKNCKKSTFNAKTESDLKFPLSGKKEKQFEEILKVERLTALIRNTSGTLIILLELKFRTFNSVNFEISGGIKETYFSKTLIAFHKNE
jgi:hypothetical protein